MLGGPIFETNILVFSIVKLSKFSLININISENIMNTAKQEHTIFGQMFS